MSHATGKLIDKQTRVVIGWYEYDGTADLAIPAVWSTEAEMAAHWRNQPRFVCSCSEPRLQVWLWTDYGDEPGMYWSGEVCLNCHVITDGDDPYCSEDEDEWPKDGDPSVIAETH